MSSGKQVGILAPNISTASTRATDRTEIAENVILEIKPELLFHRDSHH